MEQPDLLMMCSTAFTSVFGLLTVMAVLMRIITSVFPHRPAPAKAVTSAPGAIDPAIVAAINTAARGAYPAMKVTHIEERK